MRVSRGAAGAARGGRPVAGESREPRRGARAVPRRTSAKCSARRTAAPGLPHPRPPRSPPRGRGQNQPPRDGIKRAPHTDGALGGAQGGELGGRRPEFRFAGRLVPGRAQPSLERQRGIGQRRRRWRRRGSSRTLRRVHALLPPFAATQPLPDGRPEGSGLRPCDGRRMVDEPEVPAASRGRALWPASRLPGNSRHFVAPTCAHRRLLRPLARIMSPVLRWPPAYRPERPCPRSCCAGS
jgi:hypothetical protein